MNLNRNSTREKWTIMMYMKDFDLMTTYAYALRSSNELTADNIDDILLQMEMDDVYHPRNGGSTFTGQFKSIQIAWYMFGYYEKNRPRGSSSTKKMVFSPLGNLLLDNIKDKDKTSRIFLTMLIGNGFRQPFSQMDSRFNIFPFRLVFKLLRDPRLDGKLYDDEVFYLVMFLKTIDQPTYEELVAEILRLRSLDPEYKYQILFKANEAVIGLACHEWRYCTGMLKSAGIIDIHEGDTVGSLCYGNISPVTGRPNAVRHYETNSVSMRTALIPLLDKLLANYAFDEKPYPDDEERLTNDLIVERYSFYPKELLEDLGIESATDRAISQMLTLANNVYYYSHEETENGDKFEFALRDAFNMFIDVEAERIGGSGNPDVECIYTPISIPSMKFDIEAKSTRNKLIQVNSRRIRAHRLMINSKYTIIVAPNYSLGVINDINGEDSVVVKAATLANYLYQYIVKDGRNLSYATLHDIVSNNLGHDITEKINAFVYNNFGHGANDLSISARHVARETEPVYEVAESTTQYQA